MQYSVVMSSQKIRLEHNRSDDLRKCMLKYDLTRLISLVASELSWPEKQIYSNLRFVFQAAQRDGINLLEPPPNFHDWLRAPLAQTRTGAVAKPNTINARTATLSRLYHLLMDEGVISVDPLRNLKRVQSERNRDMLPNLEDITALILAVKSDATLYVAVRLMYHHAFQVVELLDLRWSAFEYDDGTILRKRTACKLDDLCYQAIDQLLSKFGGPLNKAHIQDEKILPYADAAELRTVLFQTCRAAHTRFIPPAKLRKASLRDFVLTPEQAGYTTQKAFEYAMTTVLLSEQTDEQTEQQARARTNTQANDQASVQVDVDQVDNVQVDK